MTAPIEDLRGLLVDQGVACADASDGEVVRHAVVRLRSVDAAHRALLAESSDLLEAKRTIRRAGRMVAAARLVAEL